MAKLSLIFPPLSCKFLSLQGHLCGTQRSSRLWKVHAKEAIHSWNWPVRTGDSLGDTYWYPPLLLSGCDTMNPKDLKCPWEVTLWGKKRKKPSCKWGENISFRKKLHVVLTANAKPWFPSQGDPGPKRPETMRMDPWWGRGTHWPGPLNYTYPCPLFKLHVSTPKTQWSLGPIVCSSS